MPISNRERVLLVALLLVIVGGAAAAYFVWHRFTPSLPGVDSPTYQQFVRAFQVAVTALDVPEQSGLAQQKLDIAINLVPGEPAAWANRGLLNLRQNNLEAAASDLQRAKTLAPESDEIESLLGFLAERQGRPSEAVAHLRATLGKSTSDVRALNKLAEMVSKEGKEDSEKEYRRLLEKISEIMPNSLPVLTKRAASAYRSKDMTAFNDCLAQLDRLAPHWSRRSQEQLKELHKAADGAATEVTFHLTVLNNVLQAEHGYSQDAIAINGQPGMVGSPVRRLLRL